MGLSCAEAASHPRTPTLLGIAWPATAGVPSEPARSFALGLAKNLASSLIFWPGTVPVENKAEVAPSEVSSGPYGWNNVETLTFAGAVAAAEEASTLIGSTWQDEATQREG